MKPALQLRDPRDSMEQSSEIGTPTVVQKESEGAERVTRARLHLISVLLLGLFLRLDFLVASDFVIDADEAIVGLMAKHILDGAAWPTFYYGQHYMGSFEPLVVSGLFSLVGVSAAALKVVPLLFSLLMIVIVYRIGRVLGGHQTGVLAALFAALPPSALVIWSVKARGGFVELICIGGLALLLTFKLCHKEDARRFVDFFKLGLLLGFGWWVNNQIIYFVLPIGLALLLDGPFRSKPVSYRLARKVKAFAVGISGFFIGGLPFWYYNLQNEFISFQMFGGASGGNALGQIGTFFTGAVPILLGARGFWHDTDLFTGASVVMTLLYLPILFILIVQCKSDTVAILRNRRVTPHALLILFAFSTASVFCLSSFGYLYKAPRYLLPIYLAVFPLVAYALVSLAKKLPSFSYLCITGIIALQIFSYFPGKRAIPGEPFVFKGQRVSHDHTELISWLEEEQYSWIRTNYWIGYRIAFETEERVKFLLFQKPYQNRIPEYTSAGERVPQDQVPYVLVPGQAEIVTRALQALGMSYQSLRKSGYVVLFDIKPPDAKTGIVPSDLITAAASEASDVVSAVIDGDRATRWGSGMPQHPKMVFSLQFPRGTFISGIRYDLGQWIHDYPRSLRLEATLTNGEKKVLLRRSDFRAIRYLYEYEPVWMMYFNAAEVAELRFYQVGSDPVFDWSIAEIEIYETPPDSDIRAVQ